MPAFTPRPAPPRFAVLLACVLGSAMAAPGADASPPKAAASSVEAPAASSVEAPAASSVEPPAASSVEPPARADAPDGAAGNRGCGRRICLSPRGHRVVSRSAPGRWKDGFVSRTLSLRGSVTSARGPAEGRAAGAALLDEHGIGYLHVGALSARYLDFMMVGGGSAGLEGGLGADVALGVRPELGPGHGPLLRGGARGHLLGNAAWYGSLLEAPQVQLGYSAVAGALRLEAAARGGVVLAGRWRPADAVTTRLRTQGEYGGHVSLGLGFLALEGSWTRLPRAPGGPLDQVEGLLCALRGRPRACFEVRHARGTAVDGVGAPAPAQTTYLGLMLGVGPVEQR